MSEPSAPIRPTRRDRPRKRGYPLIVTSNVALLVGLVVAIIGILASSVPVIVVGIVIVAAAIALSLLNARLRKRRMKA